MITIIITVVNYDYCYVGYTSPRPDMMSSASFLSVVLISLHFGLLVSALGGIVVLGKAHMRSTKVTIGVVEDELFLISVSGPSLLSSKLPCGHRG